MTELKVFDVNENLDTEEVNNNFEILNNNKVEKVTGKGLSSNDYTTTDKNKLQSAVQPDDLVAGDNITLTKTGRTITITGGITTTSDNIGMMSHFYTLTAPQGWLECNGQEVDPVLYPNFKAWCISQNNGLYNIVEDKVYTPNLNGKFTRPLGYSNDTLGTTRDSAIENITIPENILNVPAYTGTGEYGALSINAISSSSYGSGGYSTWNISFNASNQVNTADEVRPSYMAVPMYIKVG